jgi:hypothetical protein
MFAEGSIDTQLGTRGSCLTGVLGHPKSQLAGPQAHRTDARASSKSREPTSAIAVNEPGLGSSADDKGEEGIDRSFERTGTPMYLGE